MLRPRCAVGDGSLRPVGHWPHKILLIEEVKMTAVTARFQVSRVTPFRGADPDAWTQGEVEMTPDYADGANKQWAEATPSGVFRFTVKRSIAELFPLGRKLEITISDAPSA